MGLELRCRRLSDVAGPGKLVILRVKAGDDDLGLGKCEAQSRDCILSLAQDPGTHVLRV